MDIENLKKSIPVIPDNEEKKETLKLTEINLQAERVYIVPDTISAAELNKTERTATGLNGSENILELVRILKESDRVPELLLFPSHYNTGIAELEELTKELDKQKLPYKVIEYSTLYDEPIQLIKEPEELEKVLYKYEHANTEPEEEKTEGLNFEKLRADSIIRAMKGKPIKQKLPTGISELDKVLNGGIYGLTVIGASPTMGKTTLCTQIADSIARTGKKVLFLSLEQSAEQITLKSLSRESYKKGIRLTTDQIIEKLTSEEDLNGLEEYLTETAPNITVIEHSGKNGAESVRTYLKRFRNYYKDTPVVIIDYLQLLAIGEGKATDKMNNDKAIAELTAIAKEYKTEILIISALSREGASKPVTMHALKESGNIEYTADIVLGMQYKGMTEGMNLQPLQEQNPRNIEIVVLKNRTAPTGGKVQLKYNTAYNYFYQGSENGEIPTVIF